MPPFVVAMEEGHYGLWRLWADDDDDEYGHSQYTVISYHL